MCTVSNIGDGWGRTHPYPYQPPVTPWPTTPPAIYKFEAEVSRKEFDDLKLEFETLIQFLKLAKFIDETTGQPDCEMDEKIASLRWWAKQLGLDEELEDVFAKKPEKPKAKPTKKVTKKA